MAIQAHLFSQNFGGSTHHDFLMDNGCGFDHWGLNPQHQPQHQSLHLDHFPDSQQKVPNFDSNPSVRSDHHQFMDGFSHCVSASIEKQRLEVDHFINLQNERLRLAMQEKRKQQTLQLVKKYESRAQFLLKQKDDEISRAANRTVELQDYLRRMEMERQTWQRVAKENEEMAASLNATIGRLIESTANANAAEDAESCCQNAQQQEWEQPKTPPLICRCCNSRDSCVVMLPCRHLCCCKNCEVFLDSCPVCRMAKKASIEALI